MTSEDEYPIEVFFPIKYNKNLRHRVEIFTEEEVVVIKNLQALEVLYGDKK